MVSAGEDLCGPYVWGRYDLLVLPPSFPYGGMENPCLTFVTPTLLVSWNFVNWLKITVWKVCKLFKNFNFFGQWDFKYFLRFFAILDVFLKAHFHFLWRQFKIRVSDSNRWMNFDFDTGKSLEISQSQRSLAWLLFCWNELHEQLKLDENQFVCTTLVF